MRRFFVIAALAGLLSACSQTSELVRPLPPVPDRWEQESSGAIVNPAVTHWSSFFTDPRLRSLLETALENNRDLRMVIARVQEAKAQYGVARADRFPTVSFGPVSPVGTGYTAPLSTVTYDLDLWGRIFGMTESSRYSFLATEEARRAVQLTLVAEVASTYYEILQINELMMLLRATTDLRSYSAELVGKGREIGAINDNDVLQATVALESSRGSVAALQHQRVVAENRLNFLIGRSNLVLPEGKTLDESSFDALLRPGIPSQVLLLRADVMASEQRLRAANANIGVARAAFFPKIAINTAFGTVSGGIASLFAASPALTPVVLLPALWDAGRISGGVDVAQARKDMAVAEYEKTIQQAFREVADQISARESLARQMRAAIASKAAQEQRVVIARGRYEGGVASFRDVIDSQQELLVAQQTVISLRRAQLEAEIQLYKALGGGSLREG